MPRLMQFQCDMLLFISHDLRTEEEQACSDKLNYNVKLSVRCAVIPHCRLVKGIVLEIVSLYFQV